MSTFGPAYNPKLDGERLGKQHERVRRFMNDGSWRTLHEISGTLEIPEASVSAQLRHLRKSEFGAYLVDKRRRAKQGLWEYRLRSKHTEQIALFSLDRGPMQGH